MSVRTWLSYLFRCRRRAVSAFATCCEQRFKETHGHLRDSLAAASSADRSLPGSLNVEDLSVSISQLISPTRWLLPLQPIHSTALSLPAHAISPRTRRESRKQELHLHPWGFGCSLPEKKHPNLVFRSERPDFPAICGVSVGMLVLTLVRSDLHHHPDEFRTTLRWFKRTSG